MPSKFDPQKHHRHSIRLPNYDYSQAGAYYVTIVAWHRECLFGEVVEGEMKLTKFGLVARQQWEKLPKRFPNIELGASVIMPNHVHGMIVFNDDRRGGSIVGNDAISSNSETRPYKTIKRHALPEIVRAFKSFSAKRINILRGTQGIPVWQRNYYEHIIRNEQDLQNKSEYIEANPMLWGEDDENPTNAKP